MQINDILNDLDFWGTANNSIMDLIERKDAVSLVSFFRNHPENYIRRGSASTALIGAIVPLSAAHVMGFLLGIKVILEYQQAQEHSPSAIEIRELEKMMGLGGGGNDPQI